MNIRSDDTIVPDCPGMREWFNYMSKGLAAFGGRSFYFDHDDVVIMMRNAGFANIIYRTFDIPLEMWERIVARRRQGATS
jgi:hypothetical protein